MKSKLPAVIVEWEDANARGGWSSKENYEEHTTVECSTVGFLLKRTQKEIVLVFTQADEDCLQGLAIPAAWVHKVRRLK